MSSTNEIDFASSFIAIDRPSAGFAQAPDARLRGEVERVVDSDSRSRARAGPASSAAQPRRQVVGAIGVELDAQQRAGIALDEASAGCASSAALCACGRG